MSKLPPIDIVITWVDSNDESWVADRHAYSNGETGDGVSAARFRDLGTLKYVLRSIDKNCPWVRHIHFVTYGHIPDWLNTGYDKIKIIRHADFFSDSAHLPTFNSSAIEVNFANIPNLAERFVIFNDDTFVLSPLTPEDFFIDGLPVDFSIENPVKGFIYKYFFQKNTWAKCISRMIQILNSIHTKKRSFRQLSKKLRNKEHSFAEKVLDISAFVFPNYSFFEYFHHPQPHLLSTWRVVKNILKDDILKTSSHRFRKSTDLTQYLFRCWNLITGKYVESNKRRFALSINLHNTKDILRLAQKIPTLTYLCVNDVPGLKESEFLLIKCEFQKLISIYFPEKSNFEL